MSTVRREAGFSVLDTVVGLTLTVALLGILASFVFFENRELDAEAHRVSTQQGVRSALELLVEDLRTAGRRAPGLSYSSAASPPGLCAAQPDLVRVTADLDGDGDTTGPGEDVTYCLCSGSGGAMYRAYRTSAGGGFLVERVADDVSSLQFTYPPREVSVAIQVSIPTPFGAYSQGVRAAAQLRNAPDRVSCAAGPSCPPAVCG